MGLVIKAHRSIDGIDGKIIFNKIRNTDFRMSDKLIDTIYAQLK